jgi:serine/threonine-protein kinase
LKASPRISIAVGFVAAIEYVTISLTTHAAATITPRERFDVLGHGAFFVLAGVLAAAVASYFVRQAQAALQAVRAQDLLGKYLLHERLGVGGMAEVLRATYSPEGGFEKIVAVKRVRRDLSANAKFVALFREEAALCSRLAHPNILQVFDAGRLEDQYMLAMEFVDGASLRNVLFATGPRLPLAAATFVAMEVAGALDYLHSRCAPDGTPLEIVHCDVNPPNVLASRLGEVKLADFGVARAVMRSELDPDQVYGKLSYMAPEQARGKLAGQTDLFALGLMLFEMVTGERVFEPRSVAEVAQYDGLPMAADRALDREFIPGELAAVIRALLAPEPSDRPATGADVRKRLLAITGEAAPFPSGQSLLAARVRVATGGDRPARAVLNASTFDEHARTETAPREIDPRA